MVFGSLFLDRELWNDVGEPKKVDPGSCRAGTHAVGAATPMARGAGHRGAWRRVRLALVLAFHARAVCEAGGESAGQQTRAAWRDAAAAPLLRHRREADAGANATTPLQSSATTAPAVPTTIATTTPAPAAASCDYTTRHIPATDFCGSTDNRHVCKQQSLPAGTEPNKRFTDECQWEGNCGCIKKGCFCGAVDCMLTCGDDACYPTRDCEGGVSCKCLPPPGTVLPDLPDPPGDGATGVAAETTGVAAAETTADAPTTTPAPGSDVGTSPAMMAQETTTNVTANSTGNVTTTPMPATSPLPASRKTMDPAEAKALASTVTTAVAAVIG